MMSPTKTVRRKRLWISAATLWAGIVAVEYVWFLDPGPGARASDLELISIVDSSGNIPPNIIYYFDTSGSMNNLICEDFIGGLECSLDDLAAESAPNSATVCASPQLDAITGTTPDGSTRDVYQPPFAYDAFSKSFTFDSDRYPVWDERTPSTSDNYFETGSVWGHGLYKPWVNTYTGSGSTTEAQMLDAVNAQCNEITQCEQHYRCVYSMLTKGYFWEPASATCGTGDPSGLCASRSTAGAGFGQLGYLCDNDAGFSTDCDSNFCGSYNGSSGGVCHECLVDSDCTGGGTWVCDLAGSTCSGAAYNTCRKATGSSSACDNADPEPYGTWTPDGSPWGVVCDFNAECSGGHCGIHGGNGVGTPSICNECASDTDCSGTCVTTDSSCSYSYCSENGCTDTPGSTTWAGPPVTSCACPSDGTPCDDDNCDTPMGATCGGATHPGMAFVCSSAKVGSGVTLGSNVYIDCGATISKGATLGDNVYIGQNVKVQPNTSIGDNTYIGSDARLQPKTNVGSNVYIGANSRVQPMGDFGDDICIGDDTRSQPGVAIGDGAVIGSGVYIGPKTTVGAGAEIGDGASLGPGSTVAPGEVIAGGGGVPADRPIFLGDFLNFYPPKSHSLIKIVREVAPETDIRLGISTLVDTGGDISVPIYPTCVDMGTATVYDDCTDGDPNTACFDGSTSGAESYLFNTLAFDGGTPIAEKLDNLTAYYKKASSGEPICTYSTSTPLTSCSANNFVVVVSDGFPSGDVDGSGTPAANTLAGSTLSDGDFVTNSTVLDEVSQALAGNDLRADITEDQRASTYVISYGVYNASNPANCTGVLEDTADAGDGRCLTAFSAEELKDAFTTVVNEITGRSLGFAAPQLATTRLEAQSSLANASFRPAADFPWWEGHLFAFDTCDEAFARRIGDSCSCFDASDPDEVCILDADGNEISYDAEGYLTSRPMWDAALCLAGNGAGATLSEGWANVDVSSCFLSNTARSIYSVTGGTMSALSVANASSFETDLAVANTTEAERVIRFIRGQDVGDVDSDGNTTEDRNVNTIRNASGELVEGWWKLGDIFHSIPNTVEHPTGADLGAFSRKASYTKFMEDNEARKKAILVATNDGMLHAFHAGDWDGTTEEYDTGTGKELWAFLPPELLPAMKETCDPSAEPCTVGDYNFRADGSVMVRDVWTGTDDKDLDDASKSVLWKTVAIFGLRRGGTTVVALDVTDVENPQYLWSFPGAGQLDNNGDPITDMIGQSWLDVFPAPAAVGPLKINDSPGSHFEWVVALSAGFDRADSKGQGVFLLNAADGTIEWMAQKTSSGAATDNMDYSIPATPAYYTNFADSLPSISGVVVPDRGGQLWHFQMPRAGVTYSSGRVSNITSEIVFRAIAPIDPDPAVNDDGVVQIDEYQARPFFFTPALTYSRGQIRAVLASGDRDLMVPSSSAVSEVNEAICSNYSGTPGADDQINRLYAVNVAQCQGGSGPRPCVESDLVEVDYVGGTYAAPGGRGWFAKLEGGEKAATPFNVVAGYAFYTTFAPDIACGGGTCDTRFAGAARLYIRNVVSGQLYDLSGDGVINADDAYVDLGRGVPTAPADSWAIGGGKGSPTLFAGGSDSGIGAVTLEDTNYDLSEIIIQVPMTSYLHSDLHE